MPSYVHTSAGTGDQSNSSLRIEKRRALELLIVVVLRVRRSHIVIVELGSGRELFESSGQSGSDSPVG